MHLKLLSVLLSTGIAIAGALQANRLAPRGCDNANNCLRAVRASAFPTRSGTADCSSYLLTTVTPATSTVVATVYQTTIPTTTQSFDVTTTTPVTTTSTADAAITSIITQTTTIEGAVVVNYRTTTIISYSQGFAKRQVTVVPSSIPAYASDCSGAVKYSSACACIGVFPSVTFAPTPLTTRTTTLTQTSPVTSLTTETHSASSLTTEIITLTSYTSTTTTTSTTRTTASEVVETQTAVLFYLEISDATNPALIGSAVVLSFGFYSSTSPPRPVWYLGLNPDPNVHATWYFQGAPSSVPQRLFSIERSSQSLKGPATGNLPLALMDLPSAATNAYLDLLCAVDRDLKLTCAVATRPAEITFCVCDGLVTLCDPDSADRCPAGQTSDVVVLTAVGLP